MGLYELEKIAENKMSIGDRYNEMADVIGRYGKNVLGSRVREINALIKDKGGKATPELKAALEEALRNRRVARTGTALGALGAAGAAGAGYYYGKNK